MVMVKLVTMSDNKTMLQALALINDCNKYKMDLTTNGVVITDAIKFVQTNKEKLTMSTKEEDNGSKENEEQTRKEPRRENERNRTRNNKSHFLLVNLPPISHIYRGHIYEISVSALHQKIIIPCQLKTKKYPL